MRFKALHTFTKKLPLIEAEGVPFEVAKEALRLAAQKLPVTTKFIVRRDYVEEQKGE